MIASIITCCLATLRVLSWSLLTAILLMIPIAAVWANIADGNDTLESIWLNRLTVCGVLAAVVYYLMHEKHGAMKELSGKVKELSEEIRSLKYEIKSLTFVTTKQVRIEEEKSGIRSLSTIEPAPTPKNA